MGIKMRTILGSLLILVVSTVNITQAEPVLQDMPWPNVAAECEACLPVQFGPLEMQLSLSDVQKVLVISSEHSGLNFLFDGNRHAVFQTVSVDERFAGYRASEKLNCVPTSSPTEFFEFLGKSAQNDSCFESARTIEGISRATGYVRYQKDNLQIYWIKSTPPESQYLYFIIEDSEEIYQLAGDVSEDAFRAIVGRLNVLEIP